LNVPIILASSTLILVLVVALVREVRLRRALQALLRRLLAHWRPYVRPARHTPTDDVDRADDQRARGNAANRRL